MRGLIMGGRAAIIGAGRIGAGWAARFLQAGWEVRVFDPAYGARGRIEMAEILLSDPAPADSRAGSVLQCGCLSEALEGADWIQESVPERPALKRKVIQAIQWTAPALPLIASSSETIGALELQSGAKRPGEIIVARPSFPVEVMPLVEVDDSVAVPEAVLCRALEVLRELGMAPVPMRTTVV